MRFLIIFLLSIPIVAQDITWINNTPLIRSYSSPRTTDLNNDGIDDIVIGGGVDGFPTPFGINAFNGANGNSMWSMTTRNEMFSSPQFFDYTGDNINDILMAGRDAELRLINGNTGELIWEFWEDDNTNPNDEGWYNFYTPQIIEDQTGDGVPDILTANGGDHSLDFSELDRPPGHIMIIDGISGNPFKIAVVPDSMETYLSPIICDLNQDGNYSIIFGTGGESVGGNLWITDLNNLLNEDISNSTPLVSNSELGHIAPPSIGDLNSDGILDIITQGFDGKLTAINGSNLSILWQYEINTTESTATPILGKFTNNDNSIDVFATIFAGGMLSYNDYYQVLIDGATGNELWIDSLGLINFCSPIAFDSNNDGKDEVLISTINNNGQYFESELILIDFINSSQINLLGPIAGGNIASTPQIKDIDNNGLLDIIFSVRADSLDPFGDGVFYENGINTMRIETNYTLNEADIAWGSYMGSNFDGHYSNACYGNLELFAFPSQICPEENNGIINLYVSNGTPPFTYTWSNGETTEDLENLEPGLYSVSVTDAYGVCDTITTEISEYNTTSFSESPTCQGESNGMAYFNSTGCDCNTSFCQFIWELNGDTIAQGNGSSANETYKYLFNIAAGTYTATIIHPDGCIIQQEIIVPESEIVDDIHVGHECAYGSNGYIDIIVAPNDSIIQNYLWSTGDTTQDIFNLSAGSYSVVISDTICTDTLYFEIEDITSYNNEIFVIDSFAEPILTSVITDTISMNWYDCGNNENNWDEAGFGSYYYVNPSDTIATGQDGYGWMISGGIEGEIEYDGLNWTCINGAWCVNDDVNPLTVAFTSEGTYTLSMYSMINGVENCPMNGDEIEIVVINPCNSTSVEEFLGPHVYNNPNNHLTINIADESSKYQMQIFDINGKKIVDSQLNKINNLSLDNYQPGIYTIQLLSANLIYTNKVIIY